MKALIFAHRMEAIAFLDAYKWQSIDEQVYRSEDLVLSYSGEGLFAALFQLEQVLLKYPAITEVIHYGLAASLSNKLELQQVHSIRSIYRQKDQNEMDFTSFQSSGELDLITSIDRVTTKEVKDYLYRFAPLVDRETWAYAYVCKRLGIKFQAYKLVSDNAEDVNCNQIKNIAEDLSQIMLEHYKNTSHNSAEENNEISLPAGFYFTSYLRAEYAKKMQALTKKHELNEAEILKRLNADLILSEDMARKDKTKMLLLAMERELDPDYFVYRERLRKKIAEIKENNIDISFGNFLEPTEGELRFRFSSDEEYEKRLNYLSTFNPSELFREDQ